MELALKQEGKTHESLLMEYKKEVWIVDLFQKLLQQELLTDCKGESSKDKKEGMFQETKLINIAYENYKKINQSNATIL